MPASRLDRLRVLESEGVRRAAFVAFLLALLGYGGALAYYTVASFDVVNLLRDGLLDDALYYFEIAKNLAAGKFSTFDGGITRTNGYHPVWLLLVTPFYWVFDLESALFGIKALEIMLIAGGVCLLATAVRSARLPWILLVAVPATLYTQYGMLVGMEAAAGLFMLGAFLVGAVLFVGGARWGRGIFAALACLLPWVRLEYAAVALFATGALYLVQGFAAVAVLKTRPGYFSLARLRTDGLPVLAAIGGLLAYFLYNGIVFGGIVPVSGARKLAWSRELFENEYGSHVAPLSAAHEHFLATATEDGYAVVELCVYVIVAALIGRGRHWPKDCRSFLALLVFMLALGVETLMHKAWVALFYHPNVAVFWYYVPDYLMAALMLPLRCYMAIVVLRAFAARGRLAWVARAAAPAVCLVGLGIHFTVDRYAMAEPFRFVYASSNSHRLYDQWRPALGGIQLDAILPKDAVIGSWDAGEVGYFTQLPVVNLDGLVNSHEYLRLGADGWDVWLQEGGVPEFGITHFVNHVTDGLRRGDDSPEFELVGHQIRSGRESMKIWPAAAHVGSLRPWPDVVAPSQRADGSRNGYFELRSGRQLQLFVADCEVGHWSNVPELVTFSWREGAGDRTETRLWARPVRTELGYCTETFLLPHGADAARRISVDATTFDDFFTGSAPVLRSPYEVYAVGDQLGFKKPSCGAEQPHGHSFRYLHVHPKSHRNLLPYRRRFGFNNYNDLINWSRRKAGGQCLVVVELPPYAIDEVWMGEVHRDKIVGQGRIDGLALRPATVGEFLADAERIVHADFDVYVNEKENKLLYVEPLVDRRETCTPAAISLHVHPRALTDLPQWRRQHGFANQSFDLGQIGFVSAGRCVAAVRLPSFSLGHLKIGKPGSGDFTWRPT